MHFILGWIFVFKVTIILDSRYPTDDCFLLGQSVCELTFYEHKTTFKGMKQSYEWAIV